MTNLGLCALSLVIALGLAEAAVRIIAPQQLIIKRPDIWVATDTLGWVQRPDLNTVINTGERTVRLITDPDGFRVGVAGRRTGRKEILLLGDSFMEALQVEYEQSLSGLLETNLSRKLGEPVAIRNTGVAGWDPPQYLMEARRELPREHFNLVVVSVYLGNDVVPRPITRYPPRPPAEVHEFHLPHHLSGREVIDGVLYPINDFLEVHSQLFILFKRDAHVLLARLGLTAEEFPVDLLRREATSPRWTATASILAEIHDLAAARGVPALFVLIPAPYQVDTAAFREALRGFRIPPAAVDLDQPDRLLSAALRDAGLDVIDVLPEFRRAAATGSHLYGSVDPHLSPAGHELLERILDPVLVARLGGTGSGTPRRPSG